MAEEIFVLGAGFSKDANGPLVSEFLDRSDPSNRGVSAFWKTPEYQHVEAITESLSSGERNIEGVFNYLNSLKFSGGKVGRYSPKSILEFLSDYVLGLLEWRIQYPPPQHYQKFVDDFMDESSTGIVSFNYDILMDLLLMEKFARFDYGFPAQSKYRLYGGLRNVRAGIPLLKLHGSTNWSVCSFCRNIGLHSKEMISGRNCLRGNCNGVRRPLIVPPVWDKLAYASNLQLLWKQAKRLLEGADRIFVIGFAFSPLDHVARDLFRSSVSKNSGVELHVHNGPHYDYEALERFLGVKLVSFGQKFREFVGTV